MTKHYLILFCATLIIVFTTSAQTLPFSASRQSEKHTILHTAPGLYLNVTYPSKVGMSFTQYFPEKIQGLQVIRMPNMGGLLDHVYFVDEKGNTKYTTIAPTKPINLHLGNQRTSSFNPYGHGTFGESLVNGAAYILTNALIH